MKPSLSQLLVGLIIALVVVLGLRAYTSLEVEISLWTDASEGDRVELFYGRGQAGFHPLRSANWAAEPQQWAQYTFTHRDYRRLTQLRFDPMTSAGEVQIGAVRLSGRGGVLELSGDALRDAIVRTHEMEILGVVDDVVMAHSYGHDPQWIIAVPKSLYAAPLGLWILLLLGLWLLASLSLWVWRWPQVRALIAQHRLAIHTVIAIGFCAALTVHAQGLIHDRPIFGDGAQNLRIAHNLQHHGAYSLDAAAPFRPVSSREPVFPWTTSMIMRVIDPERELSYADYQNGEYIRVIKRVNLLWIFAGLLGVWVLMSLLISNPWTAFVAAALSYLFYFHTTPNSFYTEMHAAVLLLWAGVVGVMAWRANGRRAPWLWALMGVAVGIVTLNKALFLYVALIFIPLMAFMLWVGRRAQEGLGRSRVQGALLALVLMSVGYSAVVVPWMVRNQEAMGSYALSEGRSGWVMYKRGLLNTMTPEERKLGYALYGPSVYRSIASRLGWDIQAEDYLRRDGRVARLFVGGPSEFAETDRLARASGEPDQAVSFYQQTAATYMREFFAAEREGALDPGLIADRWLMQEGVRAIRADVLSHLQITPLMAWRGFWSFPSQMSLPFTDDPLVTRQWREWSNLVFGMALFFMLFWGLLRRQGQWVAALALPVGMVALYALSSQNFPRFNHPAIPFMLISGVWIVTALLQQALSHIRNRFAAR